MTAAAVIGGGKSLWEEACSHLPLSLGLWEGTPSLTKSKIAFSPKTWVGRGGVDREQRLNS